MNPFWIFGVAALIMAAAAAAKKKPKAASPPAGAPQDASRAGGCLASGARENASWPDELQNYTTWITWADELSVKWAGQGRGQEAATAAKAATCLRARKLSGQTGVATECLADMAAATQLDWESYTPAEIEELAVDMDSWDEPEIAACLRDKSKWY